MKKNTLPVIIIIIGLLVIAISITLSILEHSSTVLSIIAIIGFCVSIFGALRFIGNQR